MVLGHFEVAMLYWRTFWGSLGHFRVDLKHFGVIVGAFWDTLGSLWATGGRFGVVLRHSGMNLGWL